MANESTFIQKMLCSLAESEFKDLNDFFQDTKIETWPKFIAYCERRRYFNLKLRQSVTQATGRGVLIDPDLRRSTYRRSIISETRFKWVRTIYDEYPNVCLSSIRSMISERFDHMHDDKAPECSDMRCHKKCLAYEDGWFKACSYEHNYWGKVPICPICMKEMVEIPQLTNNHDEPCVYKCAIQHLNIKSAVKDSEIS